MLNVFRQVCIVVVVVVLFKNLLIIVIIKLVFSIVKIVLGVIVRFILFVSLLFCILALKPDSIRMLTCQNSLGGVLGLELFF